jgi:hypothetical protein
MVRFGDGTARLLQRSAALVVLLIAPSCTNRSSDDPVYQYTESVIPVGATVTALTGNGRILISATATTGRTYRWGRSGRLRYARPAEKPVVRLLRSIHCVRADAWTGMVLERNPHGVSDHFVDERSALRWLTAGAESREQLVWSSTGLSVAFQEIPSRGQLDVDVRQVCIRGKKPKHLSGAHDRNISITGADGRPTRTLCPAPIQDQSTTTTFRSPKANTRRDDRARYFSVNLADGNTATPAAPRGAVKPRLTVQRRFLRYDANSV